MRLFTGLSPILFVVLASSIIGLGTSCKHSNQQVDSILDFEPVYSLFVSKEGVNNFLLVDSTWQSVASVRPPHANFNREFIQRKGFIYSVNPENDYLIQYKITSTGLEAVDSIKVVNDNIEQYHWKNNSDTLLISNVVHGDTETCRFYEIDTKTFSLIREAQLPIPPAVNDFSILSLGLVRYENDKLWIAFAYSKMLGHNEYTTLDTMYYRTLDFASLRVLSEQKDPRSTYPGGINTIQTYSGTAENGDFYFTSGPGIAAGNNIKQPSAIFRKKKGADQVDTTYMVNISAQTGNHAYGFWYVGNGKAIVRGERSDKYTDFSNHHAVYQFEYFLVDLASGNMEKLDLPLDKGTRKENVVQVGSYLYIAIDDEQENHTVWRYDLQSGKVSAKLSPKFPIDYLLRLDKLN
ncbi:hypothetical protein [Sphingobacterium corticibacter]|uniref:DUF4374 domain-containing protein n=1 Tax=Sphingobacterium corticibacter TaxID=2171749 RepID=A0A2T8HNN5_9SPHI|nr:hypothetical protein [Sphingobacterium corticibacter]PVH27048.1 hypothetical protein DC487_05475 [Sphingobacterium corticibacter]